MNAPLPVGPSRGAAPLIATLLVSARFALRAELMQFPHPASPRYDERCLTIDGQDLIIFSGAFHYFRCPKPLWADRFRKIKEAGFNCVETYIAWNWHEREMPGDPSDFSKLTAL